MLIRWVARAWHWLTDRHHSRDPLSEHPRHVANWGMDWEERDD